MVTPPTRFPVTPTELYDLLHEMFGIGDYDDLMSSVQWYQARMTEIAKLKAMLTKRNANPRQVAIAAWYARTRSIPIEAAWQLFELIPEALKAYRIAIAGATPSLLSRAVEEAALLGESEWAGRLMRADPKDAAAVLELWRNRHA